MQTYEEKAASAGSYIASAIAFLSGLTLTDWGVIFGMLLGICTFGLNVWFKRRLLKHMREKGKVEIHVD